MNPKTFHTEMNKLSRTFYDGTRFPWWVQVKAKHEWPIIIINHLPWWELAVREVEWWIGFRLKRSRLDTRLSETKPYSQLRDFCVRWFPNWGFWIERRNSFILPILEHDIVLDFDLERESKRGDRAVDVLSKKTPIPLSSRGCVGLRPEGRVGHDLVFVGSKHNFGRHAEIVILRSNGCIDLHLAHWIRSLNDLPHSSACCWESINVVRCDSKHDALIAARIRSCLHSDPRA